jgi:hypothetical protein
MSCAEMCIYTDTADSEIVSSLHLISQLHSSPFNLALGFVRGIGLREAHAFLPNDTPVSHPTLTTRPTIHCPAPTSHQIAPWLTWPSLQLVNTSTMSPR